jgi:MoxR-like ATPase
MDFLLNTVLDEPVKLQTAPGQPEQVHVFDETSMNAVNAALAVRRPLLLLGEPGTGKSQLARAAAKQLGRAYVQRVVEARTEAQDLIWHFDAVSRLAEAQLAGALKNESLIAVRQRLQPSRFVAPGPLWWALNWASAEHQARLARVPTPHLPDAGDPAKGCVLLIDEIDKGEPELPNGLLEVLGSGEFTPPGCRVPIQATDITPLIIITSNEERALPPAFLRRCLALRLALPKDREALVTLLVGRARAHFPNADDAVLTRAAEQVAKDREAASTQTFRPGQAEYLDLIRALVTRAGDDRAKQSALFDSIAPYILKTRMAVR